jgi:hypothetical protein
MALPPRLWLPDGVHELPTAVPAGQLAGLWPTGGAAAAPAPAQGAGLAPPPTASEPPRLRRRALLRGDAGLPERPVLIEWFPRAELDRAEAERRKGACHVHLLRLHHVGLADPRTAYAISEAPAGVDLHTVWRAGGGQLPIWWPVAVVAAACRGLQALHQHLQQRGGAAHGGIELHTVFVAWSGAVQLLAYAPPGQPALPQLVAPEVRAGARLRTAAADVYALGAVLKTLLPPAALHRGALARLVRRCLAPHAEERPALPALQAGLLAALYELEMPLGRATAIGEVLGRVCPRAATVDLADAEWGDGAVPGFATLPATLSPLSPLSSGVVPLSPTWVMSPLDTTVHSGDRVAPLAPPRRSPRVLLGATVGLALVGAAVLWRSAAPPPRPAATIARPPVPPAPPVPPVPPAPPAAAVVPAPASVPLVPGAASVRWGGLRLQILRVVAEAARLRVDLRLTNPGPQPIAAPLAALTLTAGPGAGPGQARPLPPEPPPPILVGAGRTTALTLAFPALPPGSSPTLHLLPEGP